MVHRVQPLLVTKNNNVSKPALNAAGLHGLVGEHTCSWPGSETAGGRDDTGTWVRRRASWTCGKESASPGAQTSRGGCTPAK